MAIRWGCVMRVCILGVRQILLGLLLAWTAAAPLVWIVRDGLGPDMVESGWTVGTLKFLTAWGLPALALAIPLFGLSLLDRRRAGKARKGGASSP
jgi:hypothetical protein